MPTRLEELLAADAYASGLWATLASNDPVVVTLDVEDRHLNFLDLGHGAMIFSLADCAFSLASNA